MSEDATRTYRQYIEVTFNFDEPQEPKKLWDDMFKRGIATRGWSNSTYERTNFDPQDTKVVTELSSTNAHTGQTHTYLIDGELGFSQRKLLEGLGIHYSHKEISMPVEVRPIGDYNPNMFAFSAAAIDNFPHCSKWYSHQTDWVDDIKWRIEDMGDIVSNLYNWVNIHGLKLGITTLSDDEDGDHAIEEQDYITCLSFKFMLRTQVTTFLKDSEEDTQAIIDYLTLNMSEIAPVQIAYGCHGEVEVEKQVSCHRFDTKPEEEE